MVSLVLHHLSLKFETSGEEIEPTLHLVHIYFDTATFDNVERDQKVKFQAQLGLIGGTMGLLTGFSIISGIEIIYFLIRLTQHIKFPNICLLKLIFHIQADELFQNEKEC